MASSNEEPLVNEMLADQPKVGPKLRPWNSVEEFAGVTGRLRSAENSLSAAAIAPL